MSTCPATLAPIPDDGARTLRLTHPKLEFYVDVELRPYEGGTWIATADLGGDRDIGMDTDRRRAVEKALASLGWRYAREMAESI